MLELRNIILVRQTAGSHRLQYPATELAAPRRSGHSAVLIWTSRQESFDIKKSCVIHPQPALRWNANNSNNVFASAPPSIDLPLSLVTSLSPTSKPSRSL